MKKSILAILFTTAAAFGAFAQCPTLTMASPSDEVIAGQSMYFTANVNGGDAKADPTFSWSVSAGMISSGQGTPVITVDSTGLEGQSVTATVEVGGLAPQCSRSVSSTGFVKAAIKAQKYDEFGSINLEDEWARLDNFAIGLQNDPMATGYIIIYGGRKSKKGYAATTIKRMKTYLVRQRGMDAARFKTVDGGLREDPSGELWLVPQGAAPPVATPTVEPKPTVKKPINKKS
ncbi:MAG TPA: hypothetical protein PLL77_14985 [Pyrinomonadaceae bacterium]|nr:hypothetical protein [Pyrinomonadaceae bacterium]